MKKFRLLLLTLMLVGGVSMFNQSATACADGEGDCSSKNGDRPVGCACCSDNHCDSGKCGKDDKCAAKTEGMELTIEEGGS